MFDLTVPPAHATAPAAVSTQNATLAKRCQRRRDIAGPRRTSRVDSALHNVGKYAIGCGRVQQHGRAAVAPRLTWFEQQRCRHVGVAGAHRSSELPNLALRGESTTLHKCGHSICDRSTRTDDVAENRPGVDTGQLSGIAHDDQAGIGPHRRTQLCHER